MLIRLLWIISFEFPPAKMVIKCILGGLLFMIKKQKLLLISF